MTDLSLNVRNRIVAIELIPYNYNTGSNKDATIIGVPTGGSINIDGASAIRRSCNITLASANKPDTSWALETEFEVKIFVSPIAPGHGEETPLEISQGRFLVTQFSYNETITGRYNITIAGQDKMCLLNGEVDGKFPYDVDFSNYDIFDSQGNKTTTRLTIEEILNNLIFFFGRGSVAIIDLDKPKENAYELLEYRGDSPLYMLLDKELDDDTGKEEITAQNIVLYNELTDTNNKRIDELARYYKPNTLINTSEINELEYNNSDNFHIGEKDYKVRKVDYGETAGYRSTPLYYPGDLTAAAGETATSVLDKIKNVLSNYEYYFDVDGSFHFEPKKSYLDTKLVAGNGLFALELTPSQSEGLTQVAADFTDKSLLTAISDSPDIKNIKNDYIIWGTKQSITGAEIPIHIRVAIDKKPETPLGKDWREVIYEEAQRYYTDEEKTSDESWYYRSYYADLIGFWRDLYDPNPDPIYISEYDSTKTNFVRGWEHVTTYDSQKKLPEASSLYVKRLIGYFDETPQYCYIPWLSSLDLMNLNYYTDQKTNITKLYKYVESGKYYTKILNQQNFDKNIPYFYYSSAEGQFLNLQQAAQTLDCLSITSKVNYQNLFLCTDLAKKQFEPYVSFVRVQDYLIKAGVARKNLHVKDNKLNTRKMVHSVIYFIDDTNKLTDILLAEDMLNNKYYQLKELISSNLIAGYCYYDDDGSIKYRSKEDGTNFEFELLTIPSNENQYPIYYWNGNDYLPYVNYLANTFPEFFNELTLYYNNSADFSIPAINIQTKPLNFNYQSDIQLTLDDDEETSYIFSMLDVSTIESPGKMPWIEYLNMNAIDRGNLYLRIVQQDNYTETEDIIPIRGKIYYTQVPMEDNKVNYISHTFGDFNKSYYSYQDYITIYNEVRGTGILPDPNVTYYIFQNESYIAQEKPLEFFDTNMEYYIKQESYQRPAFKALSDVEIGGLFENLIQEQSSYLKLQAITLNKSYETIRFYKTGTIFDIEYSDDGKVKNRLYEITRWLESEEINQKVNNIDWFYRNQKGEIVYIDPNLEKGSSSYYPTGWCEGSRADFKDRDLGYKITPSINPIFYYDGDETDEGRWEQVKTGQIMIFRIMPVEENTPLKEGVDYLWGPYWSVWDKSEKEFGEYEKFEWIRAFENSNNLREWMDGEIFYTTDKTLNSSDKYELVRQIISPINNTNYYIKLTDGTMAEVGSLNDFSPGVVYYTAEIKKTNTTDPYPQNNEKVYWYTGKNNPSLSGTIKGSEFYKFNDDTTYYENRSYEYQELLPLLVEQAITTSSTTSNEEEKIFGQADNYTIINEISSSLEYTEPQAATSISDNQYATTSILPNLDETEQTEIYYATNSKGQIYNRMLERSKQFQVLQEDYDMITHWHKNVKESPQSLNFWFDFIDDPDLLQYSKENIGSRTIVEKNSAIKAIHYPDIPYAKYGNGKKLQIPDYLSNLFAVSSQGLGAIEAMGDLIYQHTYVTDTVTLTSVPIYELQPNTKIHLARKNQNDELIDEYFAIDKITVPLNYNGTMSISATKLPVRANQNN